MMNYVISIIVNWCKKYKQIKNINYRKMNDISLKNKKTKTITQIKNFKQAEN